MASPPWCISSKMTNVLVFSVRTRWRAGWRATWAYVITTPSYWRDVRAPELLKPGSSAMPTRSAACVHCTLRCSVGTTMVSVSTQRPVSSSAAIRNAKVVFPSLGLLRQESLAVWWPGISPAPAVASHATSAGHRAGPSRWSAHRRGRCRPMVQKSRGPSVGINARRLVRLFALAGHAAIRSLLYRRGRTWAAMAATRQHGGFLARTLSRGRHRDRRHLRCRSRGHRRDPWRRSNTPLLPTR